MSSVKWVLLSWLSCKGGMRRCDLALVHIRVWTLHMLLSHRHLAPLHGCEALLLTCNVCLCESLVLLQGCPWLKTHVHLLLLGLRVDRLLRDWELSAIEYIRRCSTLRLGTSRVELLIPNCIWATKRRIVVLLVDRGRKGIVFSQRHLVHDRRVDSLWRGDHLRCLGCERIHHDRWLRGRDGLVAAT